ncbi:glutamine synthetase-like [Macrosteles quadrilineatus]|uniref:glutamine synthetase-like n=1 Tax=Macrosteles quadrilineatus TaxID=74068 RepID=UPI0023E32658|nr:glutamine synthetase-like [Macrosteles quadrilineatus]
MSVIRVLSCFLKPQRLGKFKSINSTVPNLKLHNESSNPIPNRLNEYMKLKQPQERCTAVYTWIDGSGVNMRDKTKVLDFVPEVICQLPVWSYDGSSTDQATGDNSDVYLVPVAMYPDPFRGGENKIVLCETYDSDKKPTPTNLRRCCFESLEKAAAEKPWFGLEQEYTMMNTHPHPWPYMWPVGYPGPQGPYYCGVGTGKAYGRSIVEAHLRACLYCGINVSGTNAEVMPSQWEFQVGPSEGIAAADDLWVARYLLHRIAEEAGVAISLDPKPIEGDWNGTGGHVNFSTEKMRQENGLAEIEKAIKKLEANHAKHIKVYDPRGGKDNERRLTGHHETSSIDKFTWAVASRKVSVRVTREVHEAKKGYLEDRRPSANADPYAVCNALVCTILLE